MDSTKKSLLKKYKNRIKCLVKYGDNAITDDKLYVYNFAQENNISTENYVFHHLKGTNTKHYIGTNAP